MLKTGVRYLSLEEDFRNLPDVALSEGLWAQKLREFFICNTSIGVRELWGQFYDLGVYNYNAGVEIG
jgi:hypothetical protein